MGSIGDFTGQPGDELATRRQARFAVTWDEARKPPKPVLPDLPDLLDLAGQCGWVTSVLNLDPAHPVTEGVHQGLSGGAGHVELRRLSTDVIRFEPASKIGTAQKLAEELVWQLLPTDGAPYPWSNQQATRIARVVKLLCGTSKKRTTSQETALIVSTYLEAAEEVQGRTYGSTHERYEAAVLLRPVLDKHERPVGQRYLVDLKTGEYVIRVGDLGRTARQIVGGSIAHGWLDARMQALGWPRRSLDGHGLPSRDGRPGPHARADVYRGHLPEPDPDDVDPLPGDPDVTASPLDGTQADSLDVDPPVTT